MRLSTAGELAERCWHALPFHFSHLSLDAFVIMPNHIHGILTFTTSGSSLAVVVGGLKSEISRKLGKSVWQRYFFDHVIRNDRELRQIRLYIQNNPVNWPHDCENPGCRKAEAGKPASYGPQ